MPTFIVLFAVGTLIIVLGISNMRGNISSIHSYHRQRVTEENIKPFGRLVGLGTLIIGVAVIIYGIAFLIFELTGFAPLVIIGSGLMIASIIAGLAISFHAMKKYNGGIF